MEDETTMSQVSGRVVEVREMCVHDGPGVRTTVFLQGCPLRCAWCQNPEATGTRPVLLVSTAACRHCGTCVRHCPHGCDPKACDACGACTRVCPEGCRRLCGGTMTASELASRLLRQADFLQARGGVTFSGGEPMMQPEFVLAVSRLVKPLHLAIETCGHAAPDVYRKVIAAMDYVHQDVKLMDDGQHRRLTGQGNALILENVRWLLAEGGRPCVIRVPLIPAVSDTHDNLAAIAALCADSRWLQRVELLPYNFAAGAKYRLLGLDYRPPFDESAPCRPDVSVFAEAGVPCQVM